MPLSLFTDEKTRHQSATLKSHTKCSCQGQLQIQVASSRPLACLGCHLLYLCGHPVLGQPCIHWSAMESAHLSSWLCPKGHLLVRLRLETSWQPAASCLGPALPGRPFSIATRNTASGGAGHLARPFSHRETAATPNWGLEFLCHQLRLRGKAVLAFLRPSEGRGDSPVNMRTCIPAPM